MNTFLETSNPNLTMTTSSALEQKRIDALLKYNILDTPHEGDFDEIVELASKICGTPISLVSLIDENRQWFKANKGLSVRETQREIAFCAHAIQQNDMMIVADATLDSRFKNNLLVTSDPDIRFYAGMPLTTADGFKLGTLCVIDRVARVLTEDQRSALQTLAKQVTRLIELRFNLKKLQEYSDQIRKQNKELENLNLVKDKVFSIIAHDLRGPIGNIESLLQFFTEGALSEMELKKLFTQLGTTVHETSGMLDNLLNWAQNYIQDAEVKKEHFDLKKLFDEIIQLNEIPALTKGVTINNQINQSIEVNADLDMCRLVLRNLVSNAIKFCSAENTISLSAETQNHLATICVKDNGAGISEENKLILFKENVHLTTYGTANEKGTGLGLMLCKEFVNKNGGNIWCVSELGKGSAFYFTLPLS